MDSSTVLAMSEGWSANRRFDPATLKRERVASRCVCCGGTNLTATPAVLMPFVADRVFGWKPVVIDDSWGLRTIPNGYAMPICKSLFCEDCGHLFCDLRFSDDELVLLYDQYREDAYTALRESYEPGYGARNSALKMPISYLPEIEAFLEPLLRNPLTVLDWGGDTGVNTPFKGRAERIDIYDISNKAVEQGMSRVTREQAHRRAYGLVVCSMVLEHVSYPSDILLEAREAMGPDSIFYIEVPYEEIMAAAAEGSMPIKRHWHEHINFYSRDSIARLVENCGFEIVASNLLTTNVADSDVQIFQVACRLAR